MGDEPTMKSASPEQAGFGIAKATGQRLTDKTLFTQFHAFIGTPAYTSPEQAISSLLRENAAMRRALLAEQSANAERLKNDQATRTMTRSGTAFLNRGDFEAAEKWLLEALAMRRTGPDGEDKQAADVLSALAHLRERSAPGRWPR